MGTDRNRRADAGRCRRRTPKSNESLSVRLVIDASVAVRLALEADGFALLADPHELSAPALLWSETVSVLHELRWRHEVSEELAALALRRVLDAPVAKISPPELPTRAWEVADGAGWAKTYDAEYVAAALLTDRVLVTLDARLRRGAARFVDVRTPIDVA